MKGYKRTYGRFAPKKWDYANRSFAFQSTVQSLKQKCFICGSEDEIEPHHIKQVKKSNELYSDESNIVILCKNHHRQYHNNYRPINQKTFAEFVRDCERKSYNELKNQYDNKCEKLTKVRKQTKQIKKIRKKELEEITLFDKFIVLYNLGFTVDLIKSLLNISHTTYQNFLRKQKTFKRLFQEDRVEIQKN